MTILDTMTTDATEERRSHSTTATSRTTTRRCPSSPSALRAPGSPTSRAAAIWTAWPPTRQSTSATATREMIAAAHAQLDTVTLVSRAFHSDRLAPFCAALAGLCGKDMVLPMNSGAEAVEAGIKVARKWGYDVKGVPAGEANIIVARNNFHGRTTTIISFSDDDRRAPRLRSVHTRVPVVPFGDADALAGRDRRPHGRGAARADPG